MKKKKIIISIAIIAVLFLIAYNRFSVGGPESTIKELYQASLDHNYEKLSSLFIPLEYDLDFEDYAHMADVIAFEAAELGGAKNINVKEIELNQLDPEFVEDVTEDYGKNVAFVLSETTDKDYVNAFLLKKVDDNYRIIDQDEISIDEYKDYYLR